MLSIHLAESALTDLEEIQRWYSEQGVPDVGSKFVVEIIRSIESLQDHPDMGRIVPEFGQSFLRELIHPPFRIVYRREQKKIRVIRVWRSERLLNLPDDMEEPI